MKTRQQKQDEQRSAYIAAAKLDMLEQLTKPQPGVFEFRMIAEIANTMIPILNSMGTNVENETIATAMRKVQDRSPQLYEALAGRAFDTDALLRDKFDEMRQQHRELQLAAIDIQQARDKAVVDAAEIDARKASLGAYEKSLALERERLQLVANTRGVTLNLPALPALTDPFKDEELEDEDTSEEKPV